jgi:GT2 family glycosyltransferase
MSSPDVSVLISTYNQNDALAVSLPLWQQQGVEIVVADDGSECQPTTLSGCEYVRQDDAGFRQGAIYNKALALATRRFVVLTDAEGMPSNDHASKLVGAWKEGACCYGPARYNDVVVPTEKSLPWEWERVAANNMLVEADALREIGGYDEGYIGRGLFDQDLLLRWYHNGGYFEWVSDAVMTFNEDRQYLQADENNVKLFESRWGLKRVYLGKFCEA